MSGSRVNSGVTMENEDVRITVAEHTTHPSEYSTLCLW